MDLVDLDAVSPVRHPHLKRVRRDWSGQIDTLSRGADEEVRRAGSDVGEGPIQPAEAVRDEGAADGEVSKGDGDSVTRKSKANPRGTDILERQ